MEMRRRRPIISFSFHLSINRYIPYIAFFSELPLIFRILDASASIRTRCLFKVWQACLSKQLPLCKLEAARWAEKSTANQNPDSIAQSKSFVGSSFSLAAISLLVYNEALCCIAVSKP
jgi:hypothetical protein